MIEYVVVMPCTVEHKTTRVPLVLKKKPENLFGMLNLPGGKVEPDEDPVTAAVRELREETGLEEIQEYDGMCYYPPKHLGTIQGTKSIIHCVRVPISERQELNPGADETEEVKWYSLPELFDLPNLMPNLRMTIPLMSSNVEGWKIIDVLNSWRHTVHHSIILAFNDMPNNPIDVKVRAVGAFEDLNEEEQ